ncbi:hypothetical protein BDP27DRAFT_1383809 [Rhodocollybia butyracea]|uniref:Signal recognition particle subunit SRP72 n=1 Tax=Rhodocollybia butyracea TaxID=206335 RepID=A0A9P5U7J0_9AGAR|nr:hypothetical protein BDP27DRAFT_1383809 [Rhodocollybia butyracea]
MPPKHSTSAAVHPGKAFRGKGKKTTDPLPLADRLKRLYISLVAQVDGGHWKGAERTCEKILRLDPNDSDAKQTKLFIHLQREEYNKALELIDNKDQPQSSENAKLFEKAYALYRMKREKDALAILDEIKGRGSETEEEERGVMHLEAQLNYRLGNYQLAYDVYLQLLDSSDPSSEEHHDIQTNLDAAQTYLDFINSGYVEAMNASVSARDIENIPPPTLPSTSLATATAGPSTHKGPAVVEEKKKVRAKRVPKGVIPGVTPPPDPERWIKKSQRTTRPGKKSKVRDARSTGATQGFTTEPPPAPIVGNIGGAGAAKGRKKK